MALVDTPVLFGDGEKLRRVVGGVITSDQGDDQGDDQNDMGGPLSIERTEEMGSPMSSTMEEVGP